MLKIKLLPAEYGDCIRIALTGEQDINILIDGGTAKTYHKFIKQERENLYNEIKNYLIMFSF